MNPDFKSQDGYTTLSTVPFGIPVMINDAICVSKEWKQYKFPKSKKKRIRKKWSKQRRYYRIEDIHKIFEVDGKFIVSTKIYKELEKLPTNGG